MTKGPRKPAPSRDGGRSARRATPARLTKTAFDARRDRQGDLGAEACLVVVGYVSGRDPFRLLGRVAADTGEPAMPDPPLTVAEMQPVALAAKTALAKALSRRRRET